MDKILAFSILSSSPADISATGFSTRLSWRRTSSSAGTQKQQQQQQQEAEKPAPRQQEKTATEQNPGSRPAAAAERKPVRFAPEFDGINCFESIASF